MTYILSFDENAQIDEAELLKTFREATNNETQLDRFELRSGYGDLKGELTPSKRN